MNQVTMVGRLTRDPKLHELGGGKTVCQMRLAVDNPGRGGEKGGPTFVDVATFGKHAASCAEHLSKGRQIAVNGRLIFREWTGGDGAKRSTHSIRGAVEFLGQRPNGGGEESARTEELPITY